MFHEVQQDVIATWKTTLKSESVRLGVKAAAGRTERSGTAMLPVVLYSKLKEANTPQLSQNHSHECTKVLGPYYSNWTERTMMGPVFRFAAAGSGGCRIETGKPLVRRSSFSLHIGVAKDTLFMMIKSWDQSKNEATIISLKNGTKPSNN